MATSETAYWHKLVVAIGGAASLWTVGACHVFSSFEECVSDGDCALDERCNPGEGFCYVDDGPLVVGVVRSPSSSEEVDRGLLLPARYLDAEGGVLGRPLRFVAVDDRPEPVLDANLQELIDRRVHAVIGGPSRSIVATQAATYPHQILTITPQATLQELSSAQPAGDRYVFRTVPPMNLAEPAAMARFLSRTPEPACSNLIVVYSEASAFYVDYRDTIHDLYPRLGGCVRADVLLPSTPQSSYPQLSTELDALGPECVLLIEDPSTALRTLVTELEQARQKLGWADYRLFGTASFLVGEFLNIVEGAVQGAHFSELYVDTSRSAWLEFQRLFETHIGGGATHNELQLAASRFDVAMLIALATERAGTAADRLALRDGFLRVAEVGPDHTAVGPGNYRIARLELQAGREIHYTGALSDLSFTPEGDVLRPSAIYRVVGTQGQPVAIYSGEQAQELGTTPKRIECLPTQVIRLTQSGPTQ